MTKNTTDELREQIQKLFKGHAKEWYELGPIEDTSADMVARENNLRSLYVDEILDLISSREKLARIDELHHLRVPTQTLRDQVDSRLATLRKELDGGQK